VIWLWRFEFEKVEPQSQTQRLNTSLAETNRLAASFAEEVKLGSSDNATSLDFDFVDTRRVDWELSFDAFTGNDSANYEHFAGAAATASDNNARENLDSLFGTFQDPSVNVNRITDFKDSDVLFQGGLFNHFQNLLTHDFLNCTRMAYSKTRLQKLLILRVTQISRALFLLSKTPGKRGITSIQ
jgi:hypothetical protein